MHDRDRGVSAIQEIDNDLVANFGANHRAENSQPLGLRLGNGEGVVCVFDETSLRPSQLLRPRLRNGVAIQQIVAAGSVVPGDVFGGDVVMPGCGKAGGNREATEPRVLPITECSVILTEFIIPFAGSIVESSRIRQRWHSGAACEHGAHQGVGRPEYTARS